MTQWYAAADAEEVAAGLLERFHEAYGREAAGVWAAPGRVNVIGEHVDYNGGLALPFALEHRTFAAVAVRDDGIVRVESVQAPGEGWSGPLADIAPGVVPGWAGYAAGVPWALARRGLPVPGVDVVIDGRVPLGAGLSSSAAVECAVAVALDELAGLGLGADDAGRARLAAACVDAENDIAGAPTGGLDQAAALRTTAREALLLDCRDFSITPVPLDLAASGLALLVIDTHAHHALVDGQYGTRRDACAHAVDLLGVPDLRAVEPAGLADALDRLGSTGLPDDRVAELQRLVRHVVTEVERVREVASLCRQGRLAEIGPVLDASHASLRDDYAVSCVELDVTCETARAAGALGARMVGGGFGGSAIALVPSARVDEVAERVEEAFARSGFGEPSFLLATPSDPAGRVSPPG